MQILVTGGAGYIGSHTCVELIKCGMDVVIVDNFSNSKPVVCDRLELITGKRPKLYTGDVRDSELMDKVFAENEISAVIHFAGLKAVGESVEKPLLYYSCNLDSTFSLLAAMKKAGVGKLIFSSSASVYSDEDESPYSEESMTGCTNPYSRTKLMIEYILKDMYISDPSWQFVILRYFNPIGAHESGLIGEDPQGIPNNLLPYVAQVAVGRRASLGVFGNDYDTPDGTGIRDYIHVCDLARGHVLALQKMDGFEGVETINLGTGRGSSVLDVVKAFEKACGKPVPYEIKPRRAGDKAVCYCNPDKARKLLGFETEYDLDDMCRDTWNWQSHNPEGYRE